jgi:hypothetical protein
LNGVWSYITCYGMVFSPYLNYGKDTGLWFLQPNNWFVFSCVQVGLEAGNQTMSLAFLPGAKKVGTGDQTTGKSAPWLVWNGWICSQCVSDAKNYTQLTKRAPCLKTRSSTAGLVLIHTCSYRTRKNQSWKRVRVGGNSNVESHLNTK